MDWHAIENTGVVIDPAHPKPALVRYLLRNAQKPWAFGFALTGGFRFLPGTAARRGPKVVCKWEKGGICSQTLGDCSEAVLERLKIENFVVWDS